MSRVLIYKRTHPGDPDGDGVFGCEDCMGAIRSRTFDAVIGVGGIGHEARSHGFDGKLHWIGVGPTKQPGEAWMRGPFVTFDRYIDFGSDGPLLSEVAPALAKRFYSSRLRHLMDGFAGKEQAEIAKLLLLAPARKQKRRSSASSGCAKGKSRRSC